LIWLLLACTPGSSSSSSSADTSDECTVDETPPEGELGCAPVWLCITPGDELVHAELADGRTFQCPAIPDECVRLECARCVLTPELRASLGCADQTTTQ